MDKNQVWAAVLQRISEKISRMEFHTWFKKIKLAEISGQAALISCPTEMNKNWLENKYGSIIKVNLKSVIPEIEKVFFDVNLNLADTAPQNPEIFTKPKPPRKLPNKPEVRLSAGIESRIIQPQFTLQNFIVGDETRLAHSACIAIAESELGTPRKYNPLSIYSKPSI
jgi:chromosomal replication initiator protein